MNNVIYDRASPLEIHTLSTTINFHRRSTTQTSIFKEKIVSLNIETRPTTAKWENTFWEALSWVYISEKGFRVNSCLIQSIFSFTSQLRKTLMQSRRQGLVKRFAMYFRQVWGKNMKGVSCFFFLFKNQNACTLRLQLNIWKKLIGCDFFKCFQRQLGLFVFSQKSEMTEKYFLRKILIQFNRVNFWLERLVGILVRLRYWENPQILSSWITEIKSNFMTFPLRNCTKKRKLTRKC